MTAPALRGASNTPPSPREEDPAYRDAVARQDYGLLQDAVRDLTKKDAVEHIAALFPHLSVWWVRRHFAALMTMTPDDFGRILQYADPTGDAAVARAMAA